MSRLLKKKKLRRDAFSVLARAAARYLRKQGWGVLVIGDPAIQVNGPDGYRYIFSLRFTGRRLREDELHKTRRGQGRR